MLTDRQRQVLEFIVWYYRQYGTSPSFREIGAHLSISVRAVQDHIKALEKKGYLERRSGLRRNLRLRFNPFGIPMAGEIPAGPMVTVFENPEEILPVAPELFGQGDYFALRVHGDSMIGDHILDGDIAILRYQSEAKSGDIVAVRIGDEVTLKRIRFSSRYAELIPSNPEMKPIKVPITDIEIIGVFVGLLRRAK